MSLVTRPKIFLTKPWTKEAILLDGDEYFAALMEAFASAQSTIDFETYIYEDDAIGQQITHALLGAARRGVKVRLLVDGVGGGSWAMDHGHALTHYGVAVKIYHPPLHMLLHGIFNLIKLSFLANVVQINRRNHRKVCIVDAKDIFVGSCNVSSCHSALLQKNLAWRDVSVRVEGESSYAILEAFERTWNKGWAFKGKGLVPRKIGLQKSPVFVSNEVRLNDTAYRRRKNYRLLLRRIVNAKERVWIANAYFVPTRSFIRALRKASKRGVDVRLLVPKKSDVFFMPWVTSAFFDALLKGNIKVFGYEPRIYHGKVLFIDSWLSIGSTNLNQRSLLHDLECDLVLSQSETLKKMEEIFSLDFSQSKVLTREEWQGQFFLAKLLGRLLLSLKYFI